MRVDVCLKPKWLSYHTTDLATSKLYKEKNQCIRGKPGTQNIIMEIKQCRNSGYKHTEGGHK
jgi:hypothetical protein